MIEQPLQPRLLWFSNQVLNLTTFRHTYTQKILYFSNFFFLVNLYSSNLFEAIWLADNKLFLYSVPKKCFYILNQKERNKKQKKNFFSIWEIFSTEYLGFQSLFCHMGNLLALNVWAFSYLILWWDMVGVKGPWEGYGIDCSNAFQFV